MPKPTLLTIGHSNHSLEDFLRLLRRHEVSAVADVRSPRSQRLEHFNRDELAASLKGAGIRYVFLGRELGARRDEPECYEGDLATYERIARLPLFRQGLDRIREGTRAFRVALMCAEKEPLDCHRTVLVCRQLRGDFEIGHILADGALEPHEETERRLVREQGVVRTLFEPDLTTEDLIQRAYDERGREIAFREEPEESVP